MVAQSRRQGCEGGGFFIFGGGNANTPQCTELTQQISRMRAMEAQAAEHDREAFYTALALSNDATRDPEGQTSGDPTEIALLDAAHDAGYDKSTLAPSWPRVAEFAFDSERKRMTTVHASPSGTVAFMKGAPEAVLANATSFSTTWS